MIRIYINNTDFYDDFVTVVDNNQSPPAIVLNSQRLNRDSSAVPIYIQEDGDGKGNVTWTAVRADDQTSSRSDTATPANEDTIAVFAT